jgi:hypothetical protein
MIKAQPNNRMGAISNKRALDYSAVGLATDGFAFNPQQ